MIGLYDIIIIGGASAGLTSAMYTSRQGLKTLVITKDIGGQALLTSNIENYPAFEHIGGFELMKRFEEQAKNFGAEFVYEEVASIIQVKNNCFIVNTKSSDEQYSAHAIILAFGKTPKDLAVPGENKLKGRGISYCAVCDGPLFKERKVAIIGSGEPALEAAMFLKELASKVYIIHATDKPIGSEEIISLLENDNSVSFLSNCSVKSINGNLKVESLTITNTKDKSETELDVDGIFIEIGYTTKTDFIQDLIQLNNNKEIIVDKYCATSNQGIFAAGDVTDVPYKQAIISAGQGSIAALSAYNYLQKLKGKAAIKTDWKSVYKKKPT
jgi:thioredoxin reductase (NADPH)